MTTSHQDYDVAILGGGLAGLTLSLQLKQQDPDISIVIIEKLPLPYPVTAHKVGESTVELGSHYVCNLLDETYLEGQHIRKAGVRVFFTHGDNTDHRARAEFGTNSLLPIHTYQVDRGILENTMWDKARQSGVDGLTECTLERVEKGDPLHTVHFTRAGAAETLRARWLVDCTGRAGFLKNQFGLAQASDHSPSASWFRIAKKIDVEQWVDDQQWKDRVANDLRWRATNHLVGPGYWVWIIPLVTGSTSIGIVASADYHKFSKFRTLEASLDWIREHEPILAQEIDANLDKIQDFGAQRHFAHGCERVFSPERWALTGESGVFVDPFLSPGTDFIAIGNHMVAEMIRRDRAGEPIEEYVEFANETFLQLFHLLIGWFKRLYPVFDKDQALMLWVGWYFALYISVPVTLARYAHIAKQDFMSSIRFEMMRFAALSEAGIKLLADYAEKYDRMPSPESIDICSLEHVLEIQRKLVRTEDPSDDEVRRWLASHLEILESTVVEYHRLLSGDGADSSDADAVNPYLLSGIDPAMLPPMAKTDFSDPEIARNIRGLWYADPR